MPKATEKTKQWLKKKKRKSKKKSKLGEVPMRQVFGENFNKKLWTEYTLEDKHRASNSLLERMQAAREGVVLKTAEASMPVHMAKKLQKKHAIFMEEVKKPEKKKWKKKKRRRPKAIKHEAKSSIDRILEKIEKKLDSDEKRERKKPPAKTYSGNLEDLVSQMKENTKRQNGFQENLQESNARCGALEEKQLNLAKKMNTVLEIPVPEYEDRSEMNEIMAKFVDQRNEIEELKGWLSQLEPNIPACDEIEKDTVPEASEILKSSLKQQEELNNLAKKFKKMIQRVEKPKMEGIVDGMDDIKLLEGRLEAIVDHDVRRDESWETLPNETEWKEFGESDFDMEFEERIRAAVMKCDADAKKLSEYTSKIDELLLT